LTLSLLLFATIKMNIINPRRKNVKNIKPITVKDHKNTKIKSIDNFDFVKDIHLASVMVHEFSRAASTYPIVFLEDTLLHYLKQVKIIDMLSV